MSNSQNTSILRIGIITDIHFSTTTEPAAAMTTAADLRSCLENCSNNRVDFLLQLGDLIKGSEEHNQDELLQAYAIL